MKWLLTPLLWGLAVLLALGIFWRLKHGRPIVLRGRWTPRLVRMVVVVLVFLGLGENRTEAAPVPPVGGKDKRLDEALPPHITSDVVLRWLTLQNRQSDWMRARQLFTLLGQKAAPLTESEQESVVRLLRNLPPKLSRMLHDDLNTVGGKQGAAPVKARELLLVLEEAEKAGYIDPWLCAYLWRRSAGGTDPSDRKASVDLMARLHRHARLASALTSAGARIRPLMGKPAAWGTKGGRGPLLNEQNMAQALLLNADSVFKSVQKSFPTAQAGTWDSQALTTLTIDNSSAPVTMIRGGQGGMPLTSGTLTFGRLDLLETPAGERPVLLSHRLFGSLEIPAGKLIAAGDLPRYLSDRGKEQIRKTVQDALSGKEDAARNLELHLPLTAAFIRQELRAAPGAIGAARLRLILTQYDDVLMAGAFDAVPLREELPDLTGGRGGRGAGRR